MSAIQWGIFQASLDPVKESEQAGARPVLVISREAINQVLPIVAVLPLTSYKRNRRVYATEVLLAKGIGGLPADSLVLAHQIRALARSRLGKCYGFLENQALQEKIRQAVGVFLDI